MESVNNKDYIEDGVSEKDESFLSTIEVVNAREHNLQGVDLSIPHDKLVVFTGLSGSGKSSLAFDTIYAEGQRRYMETFSAYAMQFIGSMRRPDVDKISGLRPVIAIEQKSSNNNPRSTVGTVTEIYDFFRLLFARASDAYSYITGEKMIKYTENQLLVDIIEKFSQKKIMILSPVVKGRKGHYREFFEQFQRQGFLKVRVDGEVKEISPRMQLDRYKAHDIDIVIDTIFIDSEAEQRLGSSVQTAMKQNKGEFIVWDVDANQQKYYSKFLMCPSTGISYAEPEPNSFSFNSPYGACSRCNGLGSIYELDLNRIIPDKSKSIKRGGILPLADLEDSWILKQIDVIGKKFKFDSNTPISEIPEEALNIILYGSSEPLHIKNDEIGISYTYNLSFEGIANVLSWQFNESNSHSQKKRASFYMNHLVCPECNGKRLKKESLYFKIDDKNIADLATMDIQMLNKWLLELCDKMDKKKLLIAREIINEIQKRIGFLLDVGLSYLSLNRDSRSLSGGESQRIRLATQVGSQLTGVLYILDEPSIGLHPRDNLRLIKSLKNLRDIGNTVIVVEHDKEMIMQADYIFDIGPGAGKNGGKIIAKGTPDEILKQNTLTSNYLNGTLEIKIPDKLRKGNGKHLKLIGASGNNLKNVEIVFPLGLMICVTGVSGSGKSSLINRTLYPLLSNYFYHSETKPLPYISLEGIDNIDKVIKVDQSPIGRTPRSNPATYTGVFDDIRKLYADLPESKIRGYKPGRFSFNVKGGRCETCKGAGVRTIEMNFLPDVYVKCESCNGKRYNRETLEVRYKGKSINDILDMNISQAITFFENIHFIHHKIINLYEIGLGYLSLGQQSTTLSGGEAQRIKLSTELLRKDSGNTLYILDEPTTGLHFDDIRVLLNVLNNLVDKGNTVIIIEHNLDVIKVADYIIDMGPDGGEAGGNIIAYGTPKELVKNRKSYTASYLRELI